MVLVCGCGSGCACVQPFDSRGRGTLYTGIADCFVKSVQKEGVLSLWKGVVPQMTRQGPHMVAVFTILGFMCRTFRCVCAVCGERLADACTDQACQLQSWLCVASSINFLRPQEVENAWMELDRHQQGHVSVADVQVRMHWQKCAW